MKAPSIIILCLTFLAYTRSQDIPFEKIERDTIWKQDVRLAVKEFVEFRHILLSINKDQVKEHLSLLDTALINLLINLDHHYEEELFYLKNEYSKSILRNNSIFFAYGYLDFILELEKYYYFPNIYALLLNDNKLYVKPQITNDNHKKYVALVHDINELVNKLDAKSILQLKSFQESSLEKVPSNFHTIGRGSISNEEFSSYQFIDFLIILTRLN